MIFDMANDFSILISTFSQILKNRVKKTRYGGSSGPGYTVYGIFIIRTVCIYPYSLYRRPGAVVKVFFEVYVKLSYFWIMTVLYIDTYWNLLLVSKT
jgi:hypothetical protein